MAKKSPKKITFTVDGKDCVIVEPDFKQISFGLSALSSGSGVDLAGGGKAIYDVCMVECDKEIKENGKLMMSVCLKIAEECLLPVEVEIKKN